MSCRIPSSIGKKHKNRTDAERTIHSARRFSLQPLEPRLLLSADPLPIDPDSGEANLLDLIQALPLNDIQNALDHFPIPYVVLAEKEGGPTVIVNQRAGSPSRIDIDANKATGQGGGGDDVIVTVDTILLPTPHLEMRIERLGTGNFVSDFTLLVAFPFDAFSDELLPGASNLFFGYQTTANDGTPGGSPGGIAPQLEVISFTPGILAGSEHLFDVTLQTTGDSNPLRFFAGHFDGDATTGVLNFDGLAFWMLDTPDTVNIGLDVAENAIDNAEMFSSFGVEWTATSRTLLELAFLENETPPGGSTDYRTSLIVDQMPTDEEISLSFDEDAATGGSLTLSHRADSVIDELIFEKLREDGLLIRATATDIPTAVDLTYEFDPTVTLDVNANTLDLQLEVIREDGIPGSAGFFGYPLGYAAVWLENAPDLTATWDETFDHFTIAATNPGEFIGAVMVAIGDDDNLELPPDPTDASDTVFFNPAFPDTPVFPFGPYHLFSLVDDGTHGTALARLVFVESATLDLDADASNTFHFKTTQAAPLRGYLLTTPDSNIVPLDAEVTLDIVNIPAGEVQIDIDEPGKLSWDLCVGGEPPGGSPEIESLHLFGHIENFFFDVDAGNLPAKLTVEFEPDEFLDVLAQDCDLNPATVGHLAVTFKNEDGFPGSSALFGEPLRYAQARVDSVPSMRAEWADTATSTTYSFNTDANNVFLGGAQFNVSTVIPMLQLPLAPASLSSIHYARLFDAGGSGTKRLAAGVFGIDEVTFSTNDAAKTFTVHFDGNVARELEVDIDSAFGKFFPTLDIDVTLNVEDVPAAFDLTVDTDPSLVYTASSAIDEITLTGVVDTSNNSTADGVLIDFLFQGLPSSVNFNLNAATGATLVMNAGIDLVDLSLRSQGAAGIFGSNFKLIEATLEDIPSNWTADWDGPAVGLVANAPMGQVSVLISTSNDAATNAGKIAPFQNSGNFDIGRSAYLDAIDDRYWPTDTQDEFDDIYGDGEQLDTGEDHFIMRGSVDFLSLQFSGFQELSVDPNATTNTLLFRAPSPGLHPFFVGLESSDTFTTVQIEDIPDQVAVHVNIGGGRIEYAASSSPGEIDFFRGDLNPGEANDATRVVINNTPSNVVLSWGFGFPSGSANFDANAPFQVLFLTQDGSQRIVGGLQMEDLQVGYDIDFPILEVETEDILGVPVPTGDLIVARATAGIDNDVNDPSIQANLGLVPVDGFLGIYKFVGDPQTLLGGSFPAPDGGEYVPELTFMLDNFRLASLSAEVQIEVVPLIGSLEIEVEAHFSGLVVFDVWVEDFDATTTILTVDIGIKNPNDDWRDNTPIHILPLDDGPPFFGARFENLGGISYNFIGFHDFDDHPGTLFLTADSLAAEPFSGNPLTSSQLTAVTDEAIRQWSSVVGTERLQSLDFRIVRDLPGQAVAGAVGSNLILIDATAAGHGWFVDRTPSDNSEFQGGLARSGDAVGRMDLLTAVMHEIGHILGLEHGADAIMDATLSPGTRHVHSDSDTTTSHPDDAHIDAPQIDGVRAPEWDEEFVRSLVPFTLNLVSAPLGFGYPDAAPLAIHRQENEWVAGDPIPVPRSLHTTWTEIAAGGIHWDADLQLAFADQAVLTDPHDRVSNDDLQSGAVIADLETLRPNHSTATPLPVESDQASDSSRSDWKGEVAVSTALALGLAKTTRSRTYHPGFPEFVFPGKPRERADKTTNEQIDWKIAVEKPV